MRTSMIIRVFTIFLLVGLLSCVKEFEPNLDDASSKKIVISGKLLDMGGYQYLDITQTSSLKEPERIPIEKCKVVLWSQNGKSWNYSDFGNGVYRLWLNINDLDLTKAYHLEVMLPNHQKIVSVPERFSDCSNIGAIYYERKGYHNELNNEDYSGLQFKIDFKANNSDSRYYLYEVVETSEFHAPMPIEWWYDGVLHHESPPDYSKSVCWNTQVINDIYVLNTDNLSKNEYKGLELNFTDNHSQRLAHLYSINVKQYSLSKEAMTYWKQMRINMHQSGGLYNNQPIAVKGNLVNTTNPEQDVLGYFSVNKIKEKRIFVPVQGFIIIDNTCSEPAILRFGFRDISVFQYPAYLVGDQYGYENMLLDKGCVDCTSDGGVTYKPSFWP